MKAAARGDCFVVYNLNCLERKRGKIGGRPAIDTDKKRQIRKLFEAGENAADIAKEFGIGRITVYKMLKKE